MTQGYEEELRSERDHVAGLYARLDAERARVKAEYEAALGGNGVGAMERDVSVRALGRQVKRLDVVDNGLCFGRLDAVSGERTYIGRVGLFDEEDEYRPVLLDWRAPAARPFYLATAVSPEGVTRRRHLRTKGRTLTAIDDEALDLEAGATGGREDVTGEAALLSALSAGRTGRMRDIVETIQS